MSHRQFLSSEPAQPRRTSRRAILKSSAAAAPVLLVGLWGGAGLRGERATAQAGAAAAGAPATFAPLGQSAPACVVTPRMTEGPYFVDELLFRSDIREDPSDGTVKDGVPLRLSFRIADVTGGACAAVAGAVLDVWHCDALGVYSDVQDPGGSTVGAKFLRGSQYTDEQGTATFQTIYPGWYRGRTVHIHFKVRTDPTLLAGYEFTSQVFFDDALSDIVYQQQPYAAKGPRDTRNTNDGIYGAVGDQTLLQVVEENGGYAALIDIGIDTTVPESSGGPGGPVGPGGPRPPGR